jgi:hypothetical protein
MEKVHGNVLPKIHRCDDSGTIVRRQLVRPALKVFVCVGSARCNGGVVRTQWKHTGEVEL